MPKIKTNRAAAKRFKMTGTGKLKREPYLNEEVYKEKKKSQTVYDYRCNKRKEHEESSSVSVNWSLALQMAGRNVKDTITDTLFL